MGVEGNRVYVRTATTGTGTITLGAAYSTAFCTFAEAGIADGTVVRSYCIEDGNNFEIGEGTYTTAGTTLSRTTVFLSKINGTSGTTKLTLSGSATVRVIAAQEDIVKTTGDNTLTGDLIWTGAARTAYTPAISSTAGAFTTTSAAGRYKQLGKEVAFAINVTITNSGTASGVLIVSLPVTASASAVGSFSGREQTSSGVVCGVWLANTTSLGLLKYDATFNAVSGTSFYISGIYEAA